MENRYLHRLKWLEQLKICDLCKRELEKEIYIIYEFDIGFGEIDPNTDLFYKKCTHCHKIYYVSIEYGDWDFYKLRDCLRKFSNKRKDAMTEFKFVDKIK